MKRGFFRSVLPAFILVCALQAIVAAPVLAGPEPGRTTARPDPKSLWKAYPLDPRGQPAAPTKPAVTQRKSVPTPPSSKESQPSFPPGLLSVGLVLVVLAAGGVLLVSFGLRPVRALGVARRSPLAHPGASGAPQHHFLARRPAEGEIAVSKFAQRLLHLGGERNDGSSTDVADAEPEAAPSSTRNERKETLQQDRNRSVQSGIGPDRTPPDVGGTAKNYVQVGEQVTAVLASAEHAAEQIREAARQEAERVRTQAKDQAAAALSEAKLGAERGRRESEELRADAEVYSQETRGAADRYAAETRVKIDREAAQKRAAADEQVGAIRRAAEQKAKDLEREALHRQKTLLEQVGRAEARLQQLLGIFRGMTSQLEGLINAEPAGQPADPRRHMSANEPLDEALRPVHSTSQSS